MLLLLLLFARIHEFTLALVRRITVGEEAGPPAAAGAGAGAAGGGGAEPFSNNCSARQVPRRPVLALSSSSDEGGIEEEEEDDDDAAMRRHEDRRLWCRRSHERAEGRSILLLLFGRKSDLKNSYVAICRNRSENINHHVSR